MTARRADLADLPDWPRALSREQAAAYVGVSPNVFDEEVKAGVWPKPEERGRPGSKRPRLTWDRLALDACYSAGIRARTPEQISSIVRAALDASGPSEKASSPWLRRVRDARSVEAR